VFVYVNHDVTLVLNVAPSVEDVAGPFALDGRVEVLIGLVDLLQGDPGETLVEVEHV